MREVKKSVYNVSRPNHFGSIRKMPVRPEVATEREESQAEMPYEELKQKVAQFEQSKITPPCQEKQVGVGPLGLELISIDKRVRFQQKVLILIISYHSIQLVLKIWV